MKYLGVPLSYRKLTVPQFKPLIDRILGRIQHWTTKLLSYAGREQLIKSVITSMTSYWLQVFSLSKQVLEHIQRICRSFLWSGKDGNYRKSLVSWNQVCAPKSCGGLNIISLPEWNKALLAKLLWKIQTKADTLWVRWIHSYYIKQQSISDWTTPLSSSSIVKSLLKVRR